MRHPTPHIRRHARPGGLVAGAPRDEGFTLVELTVTLAVLAIVFGIAISLIVGLQQQQVNLLATVEGSHQEQIANQEVIQYLRAASTPDCAYGCLTDRTLTLPVQVGTPVGSALPNTDTVTMSYVQPANGHIYGELSVDYTSHTGTSRTLGTYYVLSPGSGTPIFTYLEYTPGSADGSLTPMATLPVPTCAYSNIAAIRIHLSFFAGPSDLPTRGYAADIATTLDTTIYLRNSAAFEGSTTTTSPKSPPCND